MKTENVKQIITALRSTLYVTQKNYSDNFTNCPRPFYNFLLMLEGEACFRISPDKSILIKSGNLIWIPKGSTFHVEWRGMPARWYAIHFDFSPSFNPFLNRIMGLQILNHPDPFSMLNDFQLLSEEKNPYLILSVFYRVFANLFPLIAGHNDSNLKIIRPAVNYLNLHFKGKIYIEKLANMCLLSRSKFQELFKKITGLSPIAYKNQLLVQSLQQALLFEQDKSLEELSDEYGFNSMVYMCRLFKKSTGKTPTEYRKKSSLL